MLQVASGSCVADWVKTEEGEREMACWKAVSEKERYMFRVRNSGYLDVLKEDMQTVGVTQEDEKEMRLRSGTRRIMNPWRVGFRFLARSYHTGSRRWRATVS